MRRILVGTRGGVSVINWPAVLFTGFIVGVVAGLAATVTWYLLTAEFHAVTIPFAIALSVGWLAGESIRISRSKPSDQLSPLE